jgi:NhaP-type Na+/H+ or K+/H+ antiporter
LETIKHPGDSVTLPINLNLEFDVLAVIGFTSVAAYLAGRLIKRLRVPQVVGFVVTGALLGPSFLNLIPNELNNELLFVTEIALGLIGFDMGAHLDFEDLRDMSVSILLIVLFESFAAFLLVGGGVFLVTGSLPTALIFGAIATATDPASTVDVLAEYCAEGPLTTRLLAVVGLDDAISLLLFSMAAALTETMLAGSSSVSVIQMLELPFIEIGGSVLLGVVFGFLLNQIMNRIHLGPETHDAMILPMGTLFLVAGIARALGLSLVLTTMTLGTFIVNSNPVNGRYIRRTIERAGPIVFVLFFLLAGARLSIESLPTMGVLGVAYLLLRGTGKIFGARLGGVIGRAEPQVAGNLGLGLLAQAGVVIGLALDSNIRFSQYGLEGQALGALVLSVVTATTLVAQIVGPIGVKTAIGRAGEINCGEWGGRVPQIETK